MVEITLTHVDTGRLLRVHLAEEATHRLGRRCWADGEGKLYEDADFLETPEAQNDLLMAARQHPRSWLLLARQLLLHRTKYLRRSRCAMLSSYRVEREIYMRGLGMRGTPLSARRERRIIGGIRVSAPHVLASLIWEDGVKGWL